MRRNRMFAAAMAIAVTAGMSTPVSAADWWEQMKFKGDLRFRHEMLDTDQRDARHRQRVRARFGIYGEVSQHTKVGIQLATGSSDPVSANQTLGDAFSTKQIGVNLAYFEVSHEQFPGFELTGGKFKNPFYLPGKSELIWDSDWNPEGGVLTYTHHGGDVSVNLIGSGLWVEERSSGDDSYILAAQGNARIDLNEGSSSVAVGAGIFNYVNTKGVQPFYDEEDSFGNSTVLAEIDGDSVDVYVTEYELLELFAECSHAFLSVPVTVMGDFVTNTGEDSLNTGWLAGVRVGKTKKPGSWAFRYIYRNVEKDAVLGAFTDSDFRGGGTDARGHELGGSVQLATNTTFNVSYFINEIGLEEATPIDFTRLQVDLQLKF